MGEKELTLKTKIRLPLGDCDIIKYKKVVRVYSLTTFFLEIRGGLYFDHI